MNWQRILTFGKAVAARVTAGAQRISKALALVKWRRILSSWQGLAAGVLAVAVFLIAPFLIRKVDPTAGMFDGGFLQWVALAVVVNFLGVFVAWVGWQIAFRSMDKWADENLLQVWEKHVRPRDKWRYVQATFVLMLAYWVAILFAIPKQ